MVNNIQVILDLVFIEKSCHSELFKSYLLDTCEVKTIPTLRVQLMRAGFLCLNILDYIVCLCMTPLAEGWGKAENMYKMLLSCKSRLNPR